MAEQPYTGPLVNVIRSELQALAALLADADAPDLTDLRRRVETALEADPKWRTPCI